MPQVLCTTYALTGNTEIRKGLFGPRIWVEEEVRSFDTNTGYDEPTSLRWRRASNADIKRLMLSGARYTSHVVSRDTWASHHLGDKFSDGGIVVEGFRDNDTYVIVTRASKTRSADECLHGVNGDDCPDCRH